MKTDFKVTLFKVASFVLTYVISYALTISFAFALLLIMGGTRLGQDMIVHVVPDHVYYTRFSTYMETSFYIANAIHMIYLLIGIPMTLLGKDMDNRIKKEIIEQQKSKEEGSN